jgi:hypothetical protein
MMMFRLTVSSELAFKSVSTYKNDTEGMTWKVELFHETVVGCVNIGKRFGKKLPCC